MRWGVECAKLLANTIKTTMILGYLKLFGNKFEDEGTIVLAEAIGATNCLTGLDLSTFLSCRVEFNGVGNAGGKALAEALKLNRSLNLLELGAGGADPVDGNKLGPEAAIAFGDMLRTNRTLQKLSLASGTTKSGQMGLEGLTGLCEGLKLNQGLTILNLRTHPRPL